MEDFDQSVLLSLCADIAWLPLVQSVVEAFCQAFSTVINETI